MKIKILLADTWFSRCVRERSDWRCERCGVQYEAGSRGLHCSHFYGRYNYSVRFEPLNCAALCYGCHAYFHANPMAYVDWMATHIEPLMPLLIGMQNDVPFGQLCRRSQKEIAEHYKSEYEHMREQRMSGVRGRIEFQRWEPK